MSWTIRKPTRMITSLIILALVCLETISAATLTDVLNLDVDDKLKDTTNRERRDSSNKHYLSSRYGAGGPDLPPARSLKPEETPEARQGPDQNTNVEKRCSRCGPSYEYDSRSRYIPEEPRYRQRYPETYPDYDRYDRYDRYDKDLRPYDRYNSQYDRYDSGRYDPRDRYERERYDYRDRYESRYDPRDRYNSPDRGVGYDNRGYDYRYGGGGAGAGAGAGGGYAGRPYEDQLRGYERGYGGGYGGAGYGGGAGYASSYYYGRGDDYYMRDRGGGGWRDQGNQKGAPGMDRYGGGGYGGGGGGGGYGSVGYGGGGYGGGGPGGIGGGYAGGGYRGRDPYYYPSTYDNGYRGTSYLYGRPSSTTTHRPSSSQDDNSVTDNPQQTQSAR